MEKTQAEQPLDRTIDNFMSITAKSTVAVVVPLYGFWGDIPENPVNGEVLKLALSRLYSNVHHLYIIFVAHPQSLPNDIKDPNSVANILLGKSKMGNTRNIAVSNRDATYNEYVGEGMKCAVEETNAQFIVIFNPWVMIQEGGLDVLVDRVNRADDAKVVSGYDVRSIIETENFDSYKNNIPSEEWDFSFNFVAMPRYVAEMISFETNYLTHVFLERDIWQQVAQKSFAVISSQRVPIFPFDFPWNEYEKKEDFDGDKQYFSKKWRFDPGLIYKDPRGAGRRDKTGAR